jgi:long-subunit fatty acid transport protein
MIVVPGAHLGVLLKLPYVRLGLSWETGYTLSQEADLRIRLPGAPMYADATLDPATPRADVSLRLPQSVRAGAEFRWEALLRTELAVVWDNWAVHDRIEIDPSGAVIRDVFGLGDYSLAPMTIERGFKDVWSVRLGGEVTPPWRGERPVALRFGVMIEPSAVPDEALTAMTVDMDKLIAAGGVCLRLGRVELEATYAYVFMRDRQVGSSEILQTNPTRPAWDGATAIGNGDYEGSAHVIGLGASLLL